MSPGFDDFVVSERIPGDHEKRLYTEVFRIRYSSQNVLLCETLSPASNHVLDYEGLSPIFDYAETILAITAFLVKNELNLKDLKAECRIFSLVFKNKEWPKRNGKIDLVEVYENIKREHQKSIAILVLLYQLAITASFTETRVECIISLLRRIDSSQSRSIGTPREFNLT